MRREEILARFKEDMRAGKMLAGMQHNSGSEAVIEVLAFSGFDFVIVDMEHSGYSMTVAETMIRACEMAGIAGFIRLNHNDPHLIMGAMETGALGVLVPHVMTRGDCEDAIAAMRYPPEGIRGKSSGARAPRWGTMNWDAYQKWANTEPLMIPIFEDKEAVEVMEDIISTPGIELVAFGPGDLSQSYNMPGKGLLAEPVMAAVRRATRYCVPRNIGVMLPPMPDFTRERAHELAAMGAKLMWWGVDLVMMGRYFKQLADTKQ